MYAGGTDSVYAAQEAARRAAMQQQQAQFAEPMQWQQSQAAKAGRAWDEGRVLFGEGIIQQEQNRKNQETAGGLANQAADINARYKTMGNIASGLGNVNLGGGNINSSVALRGANGGILGGSLARSILS